MNLVGYQLDLPIDIEHVYNIFLILQLKKYVPYPDHAIITELIEVTEDLVYEERLCQTLDHRIKQLHNKQSKYDGLTIPLSKPIGKSRRTQEANIHIFLR